MAQAADNIAIELPSVSTVNETIWPYCVIIEYNRLPLTRISWDKRGRLQNIIKRHLAAIGIRVGQDYIFARTGDYKYMNGIPLYFKSQEHATYVALIKRNIEQEFM